MNENKAKCQEQTDTVSMVQTAQTIYHRIAKLLEQITNLVPTEHSLEPYSSEERCFNALEKPYMELEMLISNVQPDRISRVCSDDKITSLLPKAYSI